MLRDAYLADEVDAAMKEKDGVIESLTADLLSAQESQHHEFCDSRDVLIDKPCNCYLHYKEQIAALQLYKDATINKESERERQIAVLEAELEIARAEVKVKCKDCNRLEAFEENSKLRDQIDLYLRTNKNHLKTIQAQSEQFAALTAENRELHDVCLLEMKSIHDTAKERIDTLTAENSVLREQNSAMNASLVKLRPEVAVSRRQITYLKYSLLRWRKKEWPGTDQNEVIERDLALVAQDALKQTEPECNHMFGVYNDKVSPALLACKYCGEIAESGVKQTEPGGESKNA
jgi:hypothetical protein